MQTAAIGGGRAFGVAGRGRGGHMTIVTRLLAVSSIEFWNNRKHTTRYMQH